MYVSARDRQLLDELLTHQDGVTVKQIATALHVSERTILRDLQTLDSLLQPYELVLEKQAGKGVKLSGAPLQLQQFEADLHKARQFDFLPEQRELLLTYKLLTATEPMKLQALATELHITVSTVSSDLDKVASWLSEFRLSLVRRRGYGVQVTGSETSIRQAIRSLLSDHIDETELLRFIRRHSTEAPETNTESISAQLLGYMKTERIAKVESAVEKLNQSLSSPIADSSYIALVVHLALAMERIIQGERIEMKPHLLRQLGETKEFSLASDLARELETVFNVEIPPSEIGYITMHLRGAKLRERIEGFSEEEVDLSLLAKRLIRHVSGRYGKDFTGDRSLEQGLLAHLSPALYRMKQEMRIHNPLLPTIRQKYEKLFTIVGSSFRQIVRDLHVPDDEVGFLVLHFGSMLERKEREVAYHAYVICSSGIGSSKMIASRLQNEFPSIKSVSHLSLFDLDDTEVAPEDLVISTIPLLDKDVDYIQVNPFLNEQDIATIEQYMGKRSVTATLTKEKPRKRVQTKSSTDQLLSLHSSLGIATRLLQHVEVIYEETATDLWDGVLNVMMCIQQKGLITDARSVTSRLKEREELSGVAIPGSKVALFHTRSDAVTEPMFILYDRRDEAILAAMDGGSARVSRILLMLGPASMSEEESLVLSSISGMIVQDDESLATFESESEETIKAFMSREFLEYFRDHIS
ncbi:BglG family transcription antiterminator [Paenalkalicoccus suaedae]|uniref:BglG family transcription antiterminator n=1 Tax=Paenalkalicoccus suaedae TaxID=2592382 RepID=A0A859F9P6_9BACI|nr:BglG family transcription antiterminator [Paenalkalicoccus suaedae]QKS69839.1 BglG family transcription antiterminator [Paenalkalicoccus suaedae]